MSSDDTARPAWLIELPTCPSTNSWALSHRDALAHGACVWTTQQSAGRGQAGKTWHSPPGVLTATAVLELPPSVAVTQLSLCAGLAVAHAVEDLVPAARVQLKWPNDCYLGGRKLAGVLCERASQGASQRFTRAANQRDVVVVGIGLNLDPQWDQAPDSLTLIAGQDGPPASLAELGIPPAPVTMLTALRRYLLEATGALAMGSWSRLLPQLRCRDWLVGRQVELAMGTVRSSGVVEGLDPDGCLLLRGADGQVRPIASGSVVASRSR